MSSASAAAAPPLKRRLSSWTGAASDDADEPAATATPPAAPGSAAPSSDTAPKRQKVFRQQLLAEAFGDRPRPPRWCELPKAQRCCSDGLALIFSFLSLFELISAARTCRSWRNAAIKANVAGAELRSKVLGRPVDERLVGLTRLRSLVWSPLRRHVHALTHDDNQDFEWLMGDDSSTPKLTLLDLAMLQHLPQLRRISGVLVELASARPGLALRFPPLLQSADVHLSFDVSLLDEDESWNTAPPQRLVLEALRSCHSLTELSITLRPWTDLCLDGLLELSALQVLTLDIVGAGACASSETTFTEEQISVIKQLSNLRRLILTEFEDRDPDEDDFFGTGWLRWLCPLPHRLQRLEELNISEQCLQLEHMELLQQLPALTTLEPEIMFDSALPLLPAFAAHLQSLRLCIAITDGAEVGPELFDFDTRRARGPLFLPHLSACTALTHLTLSRCVFTTAEATALCQSLPQLRQLDLNRVGWPSLEPLRHLPLLETLNMRQLYSPLPRSLLLEAADVAPLTRLRHLTLSGVLEQPLTSAVSALISALRPPSALLPGLVHFHFSP